MKEFIQLYKEKNNKYYTLSRPNPPLWHLHYFFENDYSPLEVNIFTRELNLYYTTYVYNDFKNHMMYIGFGEWFIDEDIDGPSWEEFSDYVNEENSCKMSVDNYLEFRDKWIQLKKELPSFALIYRDNLDWISCKGFDTQQEMESFVKNYKDEVVH